MELSDITVDEEIQDAIPKLSDEEFKQLEDNILETGSLDCPLIVYTDPDTGKAILLDGHNRRIILLKHSEITYDILEKKFTDRYEAIVWVCHNQLGRRNISPENRVWLIGTAHDAQMKTRGGDHRSNDFKETKAENLSALKNPTREEIQEQFGASEWEVRQDVATTRAVKEADTIQPGFADKFRSGDIEAKDKDIQRISKAPEEMKAQYVDAIYNNDQDKQAELGFGPKAPKPQSQSRYAPEALENAEKTLEGFDNDPFENLGELDDTMLTLNSPELHIKSVTEEATPKTVERFRSALDSVFIELDKNLRMFFDDYQEILTEDEGRQAAKEALEEGEDIIGRYKEEL